MAARIELRASLPAPVGLGLFAMVFVLLALVVPGASKVGFGLFGAGVMFVAIKLGQRRLTLDENGVTAKGAFSTTTIGWNEFDHYTFWSMDQQMGYVYGGQAGLAGIVVVAIFGGGRKIAIDARFKGVVNALDVAFEELHTRLRAAGRRDFSPFGLGNGELIDAAKGTLALPDIEKISVASGRLVVKKRGKRLAWSKVHMKNIRNGMMFIEELGEHGLIVDAKAGMFVPPTVLEKLRAATARHAALPAARVVRRD